jgi:amidase
MDASRDSHSSKTTSEPEALDVGRRKFMTIAVRLSSTAAANLLLEKIGSASQGHETHGSVPDIVMMDAVSLSRAIKTKQVSCKEVMTAYLAHIERVNPNVNAIVSLQPHDGLLKQAEARDAQLARNEYLGWMHGFPHAVKDLEATKGIRTTWGSPLLDTIPEDDAIFVQRLRNKGAILIGKTNAPEFGLGSQTYNSIFGVTRNAYDRSKTAGGSSGGAACALAFRMVPVADGSDMMGSLRNPAAFNNVLGYRPSYGRVPEAGGELFLGQLSTAGPMARSTVDLAMLLSVMAGPDPRAPLSIEQDPAGFTNTLQRDWRGTRAAWLGDLGSYLHFEPGIAELCHNAFKPLESAGCRIEEARLDFPPGRMWDTWLTLRHWLLAGGLMPLYRDPAKRKKMKPEAVWEIEGGMRLSALQVFEASAARSDLYRAVSKLFDTYDFLLLPSAQVFPFDVNTHWPKTISGVPMDTYHRWMEVVILGSLTGLPVVNVPVGFNADNLPMGMQVIGNHHADLSVLQLAFAYEQATQWVSSHLPSFLTS